MNKQGQDKVCFTPVSQSPSTEHGIKRSSWEVCSKNENKSESEIKTYQLGEERTHYSINAVGTSGQPTARENKIRIPTSHLIPQNADAAKT